MTLGTTLVSLVHSRVAAQLERWGCPILYNLAPKFPEKPKNVMASFFGVGLFGFAWFFFGKVPKFRANTETT